MTATDYWHKQTLEQPLFPAMLWNRPENKRLAGKLLIIGGNLHGFTAPATAYTEAAKAGIGVARVLLPDALTKTVGALFPDAEFAPSTPSGSFSKQSLASWLDASAWADGVLLAGDFGRNSETAIVLEQFLQKYTGLLTMTKDAGDYVASAPTIALARPNTTLVISFGQLQQIAMRSQFAPAITSHMTFIQLIEALHSFTNLHTIKLVMQYQDTMFVAADGQVSTTRLTAPQQIWRVRGAAKASTWWLQHPSQPLEALTTSILENNT